MSSCSADSAAPTASRSHSSDIGPTNLRNDRSNPSRPSTTPSALFPLTLHLTGNRPNLDPPTPLPHSRPLQPNHLPHPTNLNSNPSPHLHPLNIPLNPSLNPPSLLPRLPPNTFSNPLTRTSPPLTRDHPSRSNDRRRRSETKGDTMFLLGR